MKKWLVWVLPLLFIVTVLAVGEWRRANAGPDANEAFVMRQLKQSQRIIRALYSYTDAHGGAAPDSLAVLVAEGFLKTEDLRIDLMDGNPPARWIYLGREPRKYTPLVLLSPILTNDAGDITRFLRALIGDPPMPWRNKQWILAHMDGSTEAFSEPKLRGLSQLHGLDIRSISESGATRQQP